MSSVLDRTAFVMEVSRELAHVTAKVLGNEFAQVMLLDAAPGSGCRAAKAMSDPYGGVLRLDTNGRPLRDWDD